MTLHIVNSPKDGDNNIVSQRIKNDLIESKEYQKKMLSKGFTNQKNNTTFMYFYDDMKKNIKKSGILPQPSAFILYVNDNLYTPRLSD